MRVKQAYIVFSKVHLYYTPEINSREFGLTAYSRD